MKSVKYSLLVGLITATCLGSFYLHKSWQGQRQNSSVVVATVEKNEPNGPQPNSDSNVVLTKEDIEAAEGADAELSGDAQAVESRSMLISRMTRAEPTPYTRQLVASLTELDLSRGALTAEQAAQWKERLQQLIQQGSVAVPAIREFLQLNWDMDLGGANQLGHASLRTAFLDALQQIGGLEAQGLMLEMLQATSVPREIGRLARALEQESPGQFREEISAAVRETLAQAANGQLRGWDVGPLFHALQNYGDASAVRELESNALEWNYYSVVALANLPSGEGIPSVIRFARESAGSGTSGVAMQTLAQVAVQSTEATEALIELARSGKFSDRNWIAAVQSLGGERYFIRDTGLENSQIPTGSGVKSFHLEASNQNFYSMVSLGGMSDEQISQRVAIIDKLLTTKLSATVMQVLQSTRASLLARGQQSAGS